jgi:Fe-S-cluster formation regulator IscX/YfhJ
MIKLLQNSISDLADEEGWTFLGDLGNMLIKKKPDFDPRNYGFNKLLQLLKSVNKFEIDVRDSPKAKTKLMFVRNK